MLLGSIHEQAGDLQKAADTYRKALMVAPQFVPALNNLAYLLSEKLNKPDEAYDFALKARDFAPQHPNIADTLGWICFRKREYPRALLLLQESALALPSQPEVQFHFGMANYAMGNEEPARGAFRRSLELASEFPGRFDAPWSWRPSSRGVSRRLTVSRFWTWM